MSSSPQVSESEVSLSLFIPKLFLIGTLTLCMSSSHHCPSPNLSLSTFSLTVSHILSSDFQAVRYIELLPPEKRPVAGTEGAAYRRQQMARQLPEHDQDPSKCHELSPTEVKKMEQYVRKYKDEALGIGDVMLPEDMALVQAEGKTGTGVGAGGTPGAPGVGAPGATAGAGAGAGGAAAGLGGHGPGSQVTGTRPGGAGPVSAGFGPAGGATGTTATAGAMSVPGAQQAGLQQQSFVSSLVFIIELSFG